MGTHTDTVGTMTLARKSQTKPQTNWSVHNQLVLIDWQAAALALRLATGLRDLIQMQKLRETGDPAISGGKSEGHGVVVTLDQSCIGPSRLSES